jgi:hypothetical protein
MKLNDLAFAQWCRHSDGAIARIDSEQITHEKIALAIHFAVFVHHQPEEQRVAQQRAIG